MLDFIKPKWIDVINILLVLSLTTFPFRSATAEANRRQNVIERTVGYSEGVDLTKIRNNQISKFRGSSSVFKKSPTTTNTVSENCDGYTTSECGQTCCGKQECENICKFNSIGAHGNKDTCLDSVNVSSCGMSCCGKEDCDSVCLNYRFDVCAGYTTSPCGQKCCGKDQCASVCDLVADEGSTSGDGASDNYDPCGGYSLSPSGKRCCGEENCADVECDYYTSTDGTFGGVANRDCCGYADCRSTECDGFVFVDSKNKPTDKNLNCCGQENCYYVSCDRKIKTTGEYGGTGKPNLDCCGEADCHYKECEMEITTSGKYGGSGKTNLTCCGKENCHLTECEQSITTTGQYGGTGNKGLTCCGIDNCHLVECQNQVNTTSVSGVHRVCCGTKNCADAKCDNIIKTTGQYGGTANRDCCGADNCHSVECDGRTSTNSPNGVVACCGVADCQYKKCGGMLSVTLPDGTSAPCCGSAECSNTFTQFAAKFVATTSSARCKQGCREDYYLSCDAHFADYQCGRWIAIPTCVQEPYDRNYRTGSTMNGYAGGSPGTCGDPTSGSISTTITPIYGGVSYTFTKVSYLSNGSWQSQNVNASGSVTISAENPTNITVDVSINGKMYYGVGVQQ